MGVDLNGFSVSAIQRQLSIILQSGDFNAPARNRAFLEYVVTETVQGRADRIKAYTIATTVLGRREDFDPQQDSIVRIEAGRLRRSLERYYLTSGRADPLRIMIPTGSYVPTFSANPQHGAEHQIMQPFGRAATGALPSLRVVPFEEEGDQSGMPNCSRGFVRQVIVGLTQLSTISVFGSEAAFDRGIDPSLRIIGMQPDVDFILTGGTSIDGNCFSVAALLVDAQTGRTVWAECHDRNLQDQSLTGAKGDIAKAVVQAVSVALNATVADAHDTRIDPAEASNPEGRMEIAEGPLARAG